MAAVRAVPSLAARHPRGQGRSAPQTGPGLGTTGARPVPAGVRPVEALAALGARVQVAGAQPDHPKAPVRNGLLEASRPTVVSGP